MLVKSWWPEVSPSSGHQYVHDVGNFLPVFVPYLSDLNITEDICVI
jgi:hypothetical protein